MKSLKLISIVLLTGSFLFLSSCGDDPPPTPTEAELRLEALAGSGSLTWGLASGTSVTLNSDDRTLDWENFEITITTSKSYSTSASFEESVWPVTGTWDFKDSNTTAGLSVIVRSDQQEINIDNITGSNLTLSLDKVLAKVHKNAKIASIEGNWVFKLVKK